MKNFNFNYIYETEQSAFIFIPKILFINEKFKSLSLDAKVLYSFMLEKAKYSDENN